MLKVNVGLSRKVSQDYNSTGFSVNLEGEVCAPLDDPQLIIERIKELYDVAEESLNQQIERHTSSSQEPKATQKVSARPASTESKNGNGKRVQAAKEDTAKSSQHEPDFVPATNKQISFLLNLGKRQGMSKPQLENRVAAMIGRQSDLYELSKQEACLILDELTQSATKTESVRRN